jgi:hypothetical protein
MTKNPGGMMIKLISVLVISCFLFGCSGPQRIPAYWHAKDKIVEVYLPEEAKDYYLMDIKYIQEIDPRKNWIQRD